MTALEPYIAAAGRLCAELGTLFLLVFFCLAFGAWVTGAKVKQDKRRQNVWRGPWSL